MKSIQELAAIWARCPAIWEPKVSPDGQWLAWTWTGVTEVGNVWCAPTDGSAPPRQMTRENDHTYVRSFSNDCGKLLLAQSIGASDRDYLIVLDRTTGQSRRLMEPQDEYYVFGGKFLPDDRSIVYAASYDDAAGKAIDGQRIYQHDINSGERRALSAAESLDDVPLDLSADGRRMLYHRRERHPGGRQIWLLDLKTGEDREILNVGDSRKALGRWMAPGKVLVVAESGSNDRLGILDLATDSMRWLIDDPSRGIENAVPNRDGNGFAVTSFEQGQLRLSFFDIVAARERALACDHSSLLPIDALPSGEWIVEQYSSAAPHELARLDPTTNNLVNLSRSMTRFPVPRTGLHRAEPHHWRSVDGLPIHGWLYEPHGRSKGLIVWVHGGPTSHSENSVNGAIQFLVGAGFAVLDPNYRGSTGYGARFREAIKEDGWGGREQADIRTGIQSLIAAGKAAPGRVGVTGVSYGGYSSWYQITKSADLVSAAIPICGMYHLTIDYEETGMPHGRAFSEEMMGGTPQDRPERYFEASPANFLDRIKGRILIVHGLRDTNVSPENSFAAMRDLDRAGIAYETLLFEDEGHGIYRVANRERLFARMAEFFEATFSANG